MNSPSDDVLGRSQDVFLRLSGRINRVRFLGAIILIQFMCMVAGTILALPVIILGRFVFSESLTSNVAIGILLLAAVIGQTLFAGPIAQRAHDLGWRATFVLLMIAASLLTGMVGVLLPVLLLEPPSSVVITTARVIAAPGQIALILLLMLPGQNGENQFGAAPKPITKI